MKNYFTDAPTYYNRFKNKTVEITFKSNSNAFKIYGQKVGGKIGLHPDNVQTEFTIKTSEKTTKFYTAMMLTIDVNVGCQNIFKISEKNISKLKNVGFNCEDIEINGIVEII